MNTLTVDIGNTKVKVVVWNEDTPLFQKTIDEPDIDAIREIVKRYSVEKAIVSTVRNNEAEILKLSESWGEKGESGKISVTLFNLDEIEMFRLKSIYKFPIGVDRIAAYLGAEREYPKIAKLIIDAGTAITMDVIDSNGVFCGGDISLGLRGRLKALCNSTARLPLVDVDLTLHPFGIDTQSAILNGAVFGITGEMLYAIERARRNYKIEKILITGGDGETFASLLKNNGETVSFDPLLVSRGLNDYLRESKIVHQEVSRYDMNDRI